MPQRSPKIQARYWYWKTSPGTGQAVATLLQQNGLAVDAQPASSIPPSPDPLDQYDGLVLADVPVTSLTLDQQRTLQTLVRDRGKGLVVLGGPHSYAPGGYEGSVLDDMLPVSSKPPVERQQGSVALFLVVDKSGSMDLYNRAARRWSWPSRRPSRRPKC